MGVSTEVRDLFVLHDFHEDIESGVVASNSSGGSAEVGFCTKYYLRNHEMSVIHAEVSWCHLKTLGLPYRDGQFCVSAARKWGLGSNGYRVEMWPRWLVDGETLAEVGRSGVVFRRSTGYPARSTIQRQSVPPS
jgi:hypothetical protein